MASFLFALMPLISHGAVQRDAIVPAYFYPYPTSAAWNSLNSLAVKMPTTVIVNPNSGPGKALDQNYVKAIANLHASGGKVIGYISSSYGKRNISEVTKDINTYLAFYKLDGFFIDEMTNDLAPSHLQYYQSLRGYIKALSSKYRVTGNPGTSIPELYLTLPIADDFVVFEDTLQKFKRQITPSWEANYAPNRFISIVYNSPRADMAAVMKINTRRGVGSLFVTSLAMPDPYFKLPKNWGADMVTALSVQ